MKLRQIIREAEINSNSKSEIIQDFLRHFYLTSSTAKNIKIRYGTTGLNIKGWAESNELGKKLLSLPWRINSCEMFINQNGMIENLHNFPYVSTVINLTGCHNLQSLESKFTIKTDHFNASDTSITSLKGARLQARGLILKSCRLLVSLQGNTEKIDQITLRDCPNFKEDPVLCGIPKIISDPSCRNLPIVRGVLTGVLQFDTRDDALLDSIVSKYYDTGYKNIVNFVRELRDEGYESHARL